MVHVVNALTHPHPILVQFHLYSGRKITESLGNVTVRGEKMERARGERDGQQSEHVYYN
jgi:hypothetical protein